MSNAFFFLLAETLFLGQASFFSEAGLFSEPFFFLSLLPLFLSQCPLTSFFGCQGTNTFVDGVLVFAAVTSQNGFSHLDEFLFQQIRNFLFGLHQESFNVFDLELTLVLVEVLAEHGVEFTLFR